ncbi:hypothetical protein M878_10880 [Streptomyces roseochromogenus subsp. oscitans DS 12.976]|uniref:Uncharacterized protein n=1 Tax=Streptomyces roseochromogenus subsp. oscitans DS 12.976 TaxID=1352936 RepID=V6KQ82_STRRC|nr:hypothetical protein M878_10880 [Streptomyces roseochromogenus subsp. oscitans DS 12.976]
MTALWFMISGMAFFGPRALPVGMSRRDRSSTREVR